MLPTFKTPRLRPCEEPAHILSLATLCVRPCKPVLISDSFWYSLLVLRLAKSGYLSANLNTSLPTSGTLLRQTLRVPLHCSGDSRCTQMLSCCFLLLLTVAGTYMNSADYKINVKRLQMNFEVFLASAVSAGFRLLFPWKCGGLGVALTPSF